MLTKSTLFAVLAIFTIASCISSVQAFSLLPSSFFRNHHHQNKNDLGFGAPAPATLEVSASFFNKLTADVVPVINELAKKLVIPAGGSKEKHFTYDEIKLSNFDLGKIEFIFSSPNKVEVKISSLTFAVPTTTFHLYDKILFIEAHCAGDFDVSAALSASFSMNLVDNNGKLAIEGTTDVAVDWKNLDVHVHMKHFLCKLGEDIINLFTGGIDNLIRKLVEKSLAPAIQKALTGALEKAFAKLPVELTGNPKSVDGALEIPINLDSLLKQQQQESLSLAQQQPPRLSSELSRAGAPFTPRDIGIILPDTSATTLLRTLHQMGKLGPFNSTSDKITTDLFKLFLPAAYDRCQNCPINFDVNLKLAPTATFSNNNATLSIQNLTLGLRAVNTTTHEIVPLFTLGLLVDLSVDNFNVSGLGDNIIHFDLGLQALQFSEVSSQVGPIPVGVLNIITTVIRTVLIPDFNKHNKGINMNDILNGTGITVTQVEVDLSKNGLMSAGLDVTIGKKF